MRILLAEDDARIARFIQKGLKENAYAVDLVEDGEEALYQSEMNNYDLIILDVMMPEKDGFEVCEAIRENGNNIPILMLTAKDTVENRIHGLDTGADDYLTKPFEFGELLARLRALLRRPRSELLPTKINIDELEIDTRAQTAKGNGELITLTTKEYALLQYFARNANFERNLKRKKNLIKAYIRKKCKKKRRQKLRISESRLIPNSFSEAET